MSILSSKAYRRATQREMHTPVHMLPFFLCPGKNVDSAAVGVYIGCAGDAPLGCNVIAGRVKVCWKDLCISQEISLPQLVTSVCTAHGTSHCVQMPLYREQMSLVYGAVFLGKAVQMLWKALSWDAVSTAISIVQPK